MNLTTVVDSRLSDNNEIIFNAGRQDRSVRMTYADFVKLEQPVIVSVL
jgi:prolyl-tRNA editing enzyme YbaK/EbsC (Cys-tRNA(Pro) deacylase)